MFSLVCRSFCSEGKGVGPYVTITHDELDLAINPPPHWPWPNPHPPPISVMGTPSP